jgi:hypothetical protein
MKKSRNLLKGRLPSSSGDFEPHGDSRETSDRGVECSEEHKQMIWKLARGWINNCQEQHTIISACLPSPNPPYCPNRLIDIGEPILRLVQKSESVDGGEAAKYAALTYCWGKIMPDSGKTTSSNLAIYEKAIDLQQLPTTFRDAIQISRGIGIAYLWIDALCIIQDSREDWEEEAAAMGLVYTIAVVTIAAATSDHCNGSCLQTCPGDVPPHSVWRQRLAKIP